MGRKAGQVSLGGNPPAAEARYHLEKSLTVEVGESSRPAGVVHAQSALAASAITPIARMPGLAMPHIRASAASVRWSGELGSMGRDSSMGVTVRAGVLPAPGLVEATCPGVGACRQPQPLQGLLCEACQKLGVQAGADAAAILLERSSQFFVGDPARGQGVLGDGVPHLPDAAHVATACWSNDHGRLHHAA